MTGSYEIHSYDNRWSHIISFCFVCGGKLPDPNVEEFYHLIDPSERDEASAAVSGIRNLPELCARLGEQGTPIDVNISASDGERICGVYRSVRLPTRITRFEGAWHTIAIEFIEYSDKSFDVAFVSKRKQS